jgi:D-alanyl-D-alanine carboxypeptidase (penicillin-binding protein 5/6)
MDINLLLYRKISVCKFIILVLALCLLPLSMAAAASGAENLADSDSGDDGAARIAVMTIPHAKSSVLIEANTGKMLFGMEEGLALPPASTTKILTTILALDLDLDLEALHQISPEAADIGDASLHLRVGEELSLGDLIRGALVKSGNDACYMIAEICAGSEKLFVHWMNMKAAVLGADSVRAANTNGLPAENHQMSALDLAKIAAYAMDNDFFADTVGSKYVEIGSGSSYRRYQNTNKLLWQDDNIVGVKTGTTDAAGKCLVAAYDDGAGLFISVVLCSPDRYGESFSLLKHAADKYLLFDFSCAGECLAYLPQENQGIFFRAAGDLSVLLKHEEINQLKLVWILNPERGELRIENSEGTVLAATQLIAEAAAIK